MQLDHPIAEREVIHATNIMNSYETFLMLGCKGQKIPVVVSYFSALTNKAGIENTHLLKTLELAR